MLNTKMTKYDAYKNSGVEWLGDIPEGWEVKRIKFLFSIGRGRVISQQELDDSGSYPVYSSQTKDDGILGYINTYDFDCNQITWTTDGANAGTIFLRKGKHNCTNVCGTLQPTSNELSLKFITNTLGVAAQFYKRPDTNGAKIMNGEMSEIFVTFPPLPEQKAIADFLDRKTGQIDAAVAIKKKQIELLKERKQILIQNAVTHGLNPDAPMRDSGVEWIGEIPKHWEVKRLASFGLFSKGGGFSKSSLTPNGVPAVLYGDIYTKYEYTINNVKRKISPLVARNSVQLHSGDLLFTGSGETKEDIGKCVVFNSDEKAVAGGDIIIFKQNVNHSLFMSYCLNTHGIIEQKAKASKGEIIVHIYASKLRNLYVPMPRLPEQTAIVAHIEKESAKIDQAIALNQQQIEKLKEYKATLINSAVTGKIKIPGKLEAFS